MSAAADQPPPGQPPVAPVGIGSAEFPITLKHRFWHRLNRRLARLAASIRRSLGVRRGIHADGAYYKELSPIPLHRALSRRGPGFKDYRVTFADRSKQVIRCSGTRVFADLMGPIGVERIEPLLPILRPGGRVLEFNSGTGYRAHWMSFVVGPAGGVVAIACDRDDLRFAAARYRRPNVAFELAETFALAGELDGSFDAVIALQLVGDDRGRTMLISELLRLVSPGGALLIGLNEDPVAAGHVADIGEQLGVDVRRVSSGPWSDALIVRRAASGNGGGPAPRGRPGGPRSDGW